MTEVSKNRSYRLTDSQVAGLKLIAARYAAVSGFKVLPSDALRKMIEEKLKEFGIAAPEPKKKGK